MTELTFQAAEAQGTPSARSQPRSQLDILAALSMRELSSINEDKQKSVVSETKMDPSDSEKKRADSVA